MLEALQGVPATRDIQRELRAAQLVLLTLFTLIVLRHAWMMDDAYIALRTVDNFFAGHGLVWNVGERVQAYTHPLWLVIAALYDRIDLVVHGDLLSMDRLRAIWWLNTGGPEELINA